MLRLRVASPVAPVADAIGSANYLESAVARPERRAERSNDPVAGVDTHQREIEPLRVGAFAGDRDVKVGGRALPAVHLSRDPAHDDEFDAVPIEGAQ